MATLCQTLSPTLFHIKQLTAFDRVLPVNSSPFSGMADQSAGPAVLPYTRYVFFVEY